MIAAKAATPPPPDITRRHWVWFLIGLLIGLVAGIVIGHTIITWQQLPGPPGDCIRPDGSVYRRGVTQANCRQICPSCTWVQN